MIRSISHVHAMASYELASLNAPEGKRLISMAQNESLRPPSPLALQAASASLDSAELYPDPDWGELVEAIISVHEIEPTSILCGAGSMELIGAIAHAFLEPGARLLTTQHAYAFARTATQFTGATLDVVHEKDFTVDLQAIVDGVHRDTKIVFVANPGNPTGTIFPRSQYAALRDNLPENVLLVIDEAYGEFCDDLEIPDFGLATKSNTIFLRTFSKAYGLAGMRVGWGVFPKLIATEIRRLLNPNNVSVASQAAASAAMIDQNFMKETCSLTNDLRQKFVDALITMGLKPVQSHTNFVLISFDEVQEARDAEAALNKDGIVMRAMGGYGLPHCLRATIVNEVDMELVIKCLKAWKYSEQSR